MAAVRLAYDNVKLTIEIIILDSSEIRTLVNLDGNCTPTDETAQLLGETSRYVRDVDSQSTVCAIQYAALNILVTMGVTGPYTTPVHVFWPA